MILASSNVISAIASGFAALTARDLRVEVRVTRVEELLGDDLAAGASKDSLVAAARPVP